MMEDSMSGTTGFILGSFVTMFVGGILLTGRPMLLVWLQRVWGKGKLSTLTAQLKRLNHILSDPARRQINAVRCASSRTTGAVLATSGVMMIFLVGLVTIATRGLPDGDSPPKAIWIILLVLSGFLGLMGWIKWLQGDISLREHADAEELRDKVTAQIERLRQKVPE